MSDPMEVDLEQNETMYAQVRHKKQDGTLTLSATRLVWKAASGSTERIIDLTNVTKHQVSPASYPKALLKLILSDGSNATFQMAHRADLERIRSDVTNRLQQMRGTASSAQRPLSEVQQPPISSFGSLDKTALAVTRSSLLAANPALRQQHQDLVQETQTISEDDFWQTHAALVEEEYAKIAGLSKAGTSSLLQSHLAASGRVTLGVEEMRQIFILYPAVHKAYEEKVPLELSDEQFWRKYLESEYFHRDRGRMGTAARNHGGTDIDKKDQPRGPTIEEQEARAAAVGTDDLFSRYDQKLAEQPTDTDDVSRKKRWGRELAIGQFDLASTLATERGHLLQGPRDNHPYSNDDKGARVIQKYNRHWAMVLHPDQAVAGSNLLEVARKSVTQVLRDDADANAGGGEDEEFRRLVAFASADATQANHAAATGDTEETEPLTLQNIESYYVGQQQSKREDKATEQETAEHHAVFAQAMTAKMQNLVHKLDESNGQLPSNVFPPAPLGRELLSALTKKMAQDSRTEAASLNMVNSLPKDFRKKLHSYFRRSSELLRHFFALRRLEAAQSNASQKLARIVRGMETFYREMEGMRKGLPQTETGEMMRKMCLPIMDQLDWAFKLYREGIGGGGGGGFVAVEEL